MIQLLLKPFQHTTGHLSKIIKEMKLNNKKVEDDPMQYFD